MKISIFCALFAVLLLTATSCKKEPPAERCTGHTPIYQLNTNPLTQAGYIDCFRDLAESIRIFKFFAANDSFTQQNVKSVTLDPVNQITVTLPASSGFTFADFISADISINGSIKLATMPVGATGAKIDFIKTGEVDLKDIYFKDHPNSAFNYINFKARTTKAMPSLSIEIQYTIRRCQL